MVGLHHHCLESYTSLLLGRGRPRKISESEEKEEREGEEGEEEEENGEGKKGKGIEGEVCASIVQQHSHVTVTLLERRRLTILSFCLTFSGSS